MSAFGRVTGTVPLTPGSPGMPADVGVAGVAGAGAEGALGRAGEPLGQLGRRAVDRRRRRVDGEQRLAQVGAGLRAVGRVAGERAVDQVDEPDRQRGPQVAEVGGVALEAGERGVGVGLAEERHAAGEALVQHERERVEVGAAVEAATADLLGRQVLGRAHHHVVAREVVVAGGETLGDAEVGEQHAAVGRDEDVAGLHVAVDEAGAVRLVERAGDGGADVDGELGAEPLLGVEQLAQALAVDELHHDGLAAVVHEHVVDGDDVRVAEAGDRDRLAPEALGDHRVGGEVGAQPLDRDLAVEVDVGRDPHLGHAALTDATLQLVAAGEHLTGGRVRRRGCTGGHDRHVTLVGRDGSIRAIDAAASRRAQRCAQSRALNATPIVPRPACVPITGPISPTTISPAKCGRSMSTNWSTSEQSAWSTASDSIRPSNSATLSTRNLSAFERGALLATLLDLAVDHRDDRLDRERRGEHRLGAADAAALLQVLERVERAEHAGAGGEVGGERGDLVEAAARGSALRAQAMAMVPTPSVTLRLSTTRTGITSATERAASSALCIVADSAPESETTTMPVAPSACSARYTCSNWPGAGAAVSGSVALVAHCAQNSAVVSCSRSMNSSSPNRIDSGTTRMP